MQTYCLLFLVRFWWLVPRRCRGRRVKKLDVATEVENSQLQQLQPGCLASYVNAFACQPPCRSQHPCIPEEACSISDGAFPPGSLQNHLKPADPSRLATGSRPQHKGQSNPKKKRRTIQSTCTFDTLDFPSPPPGVHFTSKFSTQKSEGRNT
jgi:hypothetical protein